MKLFISAALIAVAAAGRLEHLENSYLPPDHSHGQAGFGAQGFRSSFGGQTGSNGGHSGSFGGQSGSFGGQSGAFGGQSGSFGGQSGSFGGQSGSFGGHSGSGLDSNVIDSAAGFSGATSNQYLPPNYGSSGSNGQFSGSLTGFQRSQSAPQYSGSQYQANQYGSASNGLAQTRYQPGSGLVNSQYPSASRQYLAPKSQNTPQQAFDEQTGYHY